MLRHWCSTKPFPKNGSASFLESSNGLTRKHSSLFEEEKLPILNGSRTKQCDGDTEQKHRSQEKSIGWVRQKRMDDAMEASAIYTHTQTPYLYKQIAYFYSQQLTLFFYQFCWPNSNNHKTNFVEFSIFNFTALHFACCQQTLEVHSQNCILGVYIRSLPHPTLALVALSQFLSLFKPAILWLIPPKCGPHFALFIPSISAFLSLSLSHSLDRAVLNW